MARRYHPSTMRRKRTFLPLSELPVIARRRALRLTPCHLPFIREAFNPASDFLVFKTRYFAIQRTAAFPSHTPARHSPTLKRI